MFSLRGDDPLLPAGGATPLHSFTAGGRPPCTPRHGRASPLRSLPTGDAAKNGRRFARPRRG